MTPPAAVWPLGAIGFWIAAFALWTHGFQAFSEFRALEVAPGPLPRVAPDLAWIDEDGGRESISANSGRWVLVSLFYASCPTVCGIARSKLFQVVDQIGPQVGDRLRVVSLSIAGDQPEELRLIASSSPIWRFGMLEGGAVETGDARLEALGALVVRRPDGEYNHSTRFFLINPAGQLAAILPPERPELTAQRVLEHLR